MVVLCHGVAQSSPSVTGGVGGGVEELRLKCDKSKSAEAGGLQSIDYEVISS
jgi:hypothetical protein